MFCRREMQKKCNFMLPPFPPPPPPKNKLTKRAFNKPISAVTNFFAMFQVGFSASDRADLSHPPPPTTSPPAMEALPEICRRAGLASVAIIKLHSPMTPLSKHMQQEHHHGPCDLEQLKSFFMRPGISHGASGWDKASWCLPPTVRGEPRWRARPPANPCNYVLRLGGQGSSAAEGLLQLFIF